MSLVTLSLEEMPSTPSPNRTDTTPTRFSSPKRKREAEKEDGSTYPSPVRLRTELPTRIIENDLEGPGSPRTKMSKQMQSLNLHGHANIPTRGREAKTSTVTDGIPQQGSDLESDSIDVLKAKSQAPTSPSDLEGVPAISSPIESLKSIASKVTGVELLPLSTSQLEPPDTPTLKPTDSPHASPGPISPLSVTTTIPRFAGQGSPTSRNAHHSPIQRLKSPPPMSGSKSVSSLVWNDSEITGHSPTDPTDDGYGINGIGFKPTAAIAYDRLQRRKRQVAEWKSREAREARMRRM